MTIANFQKQILSWYKTNRRDLPWRNTKDPYKILVSEIMLQQTQVSRVLPKYKEFLEEFPTRLILARARIKRVLKVWQGLGYWRRAKYLKQIAEILVKAQAMNLQTSPRRSASTVFAKGEVAGREYRLANFAGNLNSRSFKIPLPSDLEILPGIGHYTSRALACFAFGNNEAFLDTNIRRVYLHFFFKNKKNVSDSEILPIAQKAVWQKNPREWHYALFDYGAMVLKNKKINKQSKHYMKQSKFKGSFRSFRTKVMHFLLTKPQGKIAKKELQQFLQNELHKEKSKYSANEIIIALLKDKLIKRSKEDYTF